MKHQLLTPKDVKSSRFTTRTNPFTRRDWYDANEVDRLLDSVYATLTECAFEINKLRKDVSKHGPSSDIDAGQ